MVDIMSALNMIFVPMNLLGLFFGVLVGIAFGCMPGLSVNMGLALLFPLAFTFHGIGGILMLLGIYCGAIYGGSISAILLKTPGTPASVATTLDGYPMATKLGQPGRALGLSTLASTFGGSYRLQYGRRRCSRPPPGRISGRWHPYPCQWQRCGSSCPARWS